MYICIALKQQKKIKKYTMKKTLLFLLSIILVCSVSLSAQKPFSGTIQYSYKIIGTDDPNVTSQVPPPQEKTISEGMSKSVNAQEGITVTIISDGVNKNVTTVLDITGIGAYYIKTEKDKIEEQFKNLEYTFDNTGEKKTIMGYEAEKVIVNILDLETDEEVKLTYYVSKELNNTDALNFMEAPGLVGLVLGQEITSPELGEGVTLVIEATELTPIKKVKPTTFLLPAGSKDIKEAPAEIKQMLGMDEE